MGPAGLIMSYRGGSPRDLPRTRVLTGEFWQSSGRARLWNLHVKQPVEKKTDKWPHALTQKISPVQENDTCSGQPARAVTGDASHSRDILVVSYLWASIERVVGRLEWSGNKPPRETPDGSRRGDAL